MMPTLTFVSTSQSFRDHILITLPDNVKHIGGGVVQFHDQPFGAASGGTDDGGNIECAAAHSDLRHTAFGRTIFDVQQGCALTDLSNHLHRVSATGFDPVGVEFEQHT